MPIRIHEPIENRTLWRYMNLEKLLWLLQRNCLYFSQLKKFKDLYEGTASIALQWAGTVDNVVFEPIKDKQIQEHLYVNCWHSNNDESAAMWAVYSENQWRGYNDDPGSS